MKTLFKTRLLSPLMICLIGGAPLSDAHEAICDLGSPWLTEEVASLMLTSDSVKDHVRINVQEDSSSVELQLLLWAVAKGIISVDNLTEKVDAESIVERDDDALLSLLWIIAETNIDPDNKLGAEAFLNVLNAWADNTLRERPRRMFLTVIAASAISGKQQISLVELEAMSFRIRDPELLQNMAAKHIQEAKQELAHGLLIEALEGGLFSSLFGLGDLEATNFPACAERGEVYRTLFAAVWLGK